MKTIMIPIVTILLGTLTAQSSALEENTTNKADFNEYTPQETPLE